MYTVYIVKCKTPNHYYIGQTTQFSERTRRHQNGTGAKFVQRHGFKSIIALEKVATRDEAIAAERKWFYNYQLMGCILGGCYSMDIQRRPEGTPPITRQHDA